tara:strand:+ start:752 stop:2224 length:1473 start_codon:yes stop_codon:yes gene_type:complete
MPALTHNRVRNGFNGGRRLLNATAGVKFGRTVGTTNSDATRAKALVGGIGGKSKFARRAIQRRGITSESGSCCSEKIKIGLKIITQVDKNTNDSTPTIVFTSTEPGIVVSNRAFTTSKNVLRGKNTLTFNTLADGTYKDIYLEIHSKTNKRFSERVFLDQFTIDTNALLLSVTTAIATPSNNLTPTFVFTSNKTGTVVSSLAFTSSPNVSAAANNNIIFNIPAGTDQNMTGETITVTDLVGNIVSLTIPDFYVDSVKPVLNVVTEVRTPSTLTTPKFEFATSEVGTLASNYPFGISTLANITAVGNYAITFDPLVPNTYSDAFVTVEDSNNNVSNQLQLAPFEIKNITETYNVSFNTVPEYELIEVSTVNTITQAQTLTLVRGNAYRFNLNALGGAHPFVIHTTNQTGLNIITGIDYKLDTAEYYQPIDASGNDIPFLEHDDGTNIVYDANAQAKSSGILTLIIPANAPTILYYRCTIHDNMIGTINIPN